MEEEEEQIIRTCKKWEFSYERGTILGRIQLVVPISLVMERQQSQLTPIPKAFELGISTPRLKSNVTFLQY